MRLARSLAALALVAVAAACSGGGDGPFIPTDPGFPTDGGSGGGTGESAVFQLVASDSIVRIAPGAAQDVALFVVRSGSVGAVSLSIVGSTPGVTATLAPSDLPAGTSTGRIALAVGAGVRASTVIPVVVRAHADGVNDRTVTIVVQVKAPADPNKEPYAAPIGTPVALPAGITATFQGFDGRLPATSPQAKQQPCYGREALNASSGYVALCVRLTNSTGSAITVTLPPGLLFIPQYVGTQRGLLLWKVDVVVPANSTIERIVMLYCATEDAEPSASTDAYTLGPVPQQALAQELVTMLADRAPASEDDHDDVQSMVWLVAEKGDQADNVRPLLQMLAGRLPKR